MDGAWLSRNAGDNGLLLLVNLVIFKYRSMLRRLPINCRINAVMKQRHVKRRTCIPFGNFRRLHGDFAGGWFMTLLIPS